MSNAIQKLLVFETIKASVLELSEIDQSKFIVTTGNKFFNRHQGNLARYQIRPAEFKK